MLQTVASAADPRFHFLVDNVVDGKSQVWTLANRDGIDLEKLHERHLPVTYVSDLDLVPQAPKNVRFVGGAIDELQRLPQVTTLDMSGTKIDFSDIQTIAKLTSLTTLVLDVTSTTDQILAASAACQSLRFVSVHETDVTDAGVAAFQQLRPDVVVSYGKGATRVALLERK